MQVYYRNTSDNGVTFGAVVFQAEMREDLPLMIRTVRAAVTQGRISSKSADRFVRVTFEPPLSGSAINALVDQVRTVFPS
jgi:hypothetical protein